MVDFLGHSLLPTKYGLEYNLSTHETSGTSSYYVGWS